MGIFSDYAGNGFRGGFEFETKTQDDVSGQIRGAHNAKLSILAILDQVDTDQKMMMELRQLLQVFITASQKA
jgi:hypothetical protein